MKISVGLVLIIALRIAIIAGEPVLVTDADYLLYASAYYMHIEAEDSLGQDRFTLRKGYATTDGFWAYEDTLPDTVLGGLSLFQTENNPVIDYHFNNTYYPSLRLRIAPIAELEYDDTLALLFYENINRGRSVCPDTFFIAAEFFYNMDSSGFIDTAQELDCPMYEISDDRFVEFALFSTGKAKLYIDYFKVSCSLGKSLIDEAEYDLRIINSVYYDLLNRDIAGWQIEVPDNRGHRLPKKYVTDLIFFTVDRYYPQIIKQKYKDVDLSGTLE